MGGGWPSGAGPDQDTPTAMSPKSAMVLPLSDVTTMDGATAGHHSSRYTVLWGLRWRGAAEGGVGAACPALSARPHAGPARSGGCRAGTVTSWPTTPHPAQSTAPEAQGFRPLPVFGVTTGNNTGDHKLVKLPLERSGQGGLRSLVLLGAAVEPARCSHTPIPRLPPAAQEAPRCPPWRGP